MVESVMRPNADIRRYFSTVSYFIDFFVSGSQISVWDDKKRVSPDRLRIGNVPFGPKWYIVECVRTHCVGIAILAV